MAREAYSRKDICEIFNIPGDIEDEQDVVRLTAIALNGDPENLDFVEETLQERLWIDFPDGYPPQALPSASPDGTTAAVMDEVEEDSAETAGGEERDPPNYSKRMVGEAEDRSTCPDAEVPTVQKNTDKTQEYKKTRTRHGRKTRTRRGRKTRRDTVPRALGVVVGDSQFRRLLSKHGQQEWTTDIKVSGLLCLIDLILRIHKPGGIRIPAGLAESYVSEICRRKNPETIRQPLLLLERIGLLERVKEYSFGCIKDPRWYVIPQKHLANQAKKNVPVTSSRHEKLENPYERKEKRFNKTWKWRQQLLEDLPKLKLSQEGDKIALELLRDREKEQAMRSVLQFLDGTQKAKAWEDGYGTIRHNLNSCPKEAKPHFLFDGEAVCLCDIAHAFHCILPLLLRNRIDYRRDKGLRTELEEAELSVLVEFLSHGDYYKKLAPNEMDRQSVKDSANTVLNMKNNEVQGIPLYRTLKSMFPMTFGVVEDIKGPDHRNIYKPLAHHTAQIINAALKEVQGRAIPAMPDTDSLIVPARFKEVACEAIGRAMYKLTGVCCNVDNVRYQPPANRQHAAA